MTKKPEIILGTAQWGLNYGITNNSGKVNQEEIHKIVEYCLKNNIKTFDTARDYGNSEEIIGELNIKFFRQIQTISKIKNFDLKGNNYDKANIKDFVLKTHKNTSNQSIEGMLIYDKLLEHKYFPNLWEVLIELKDNNIIKKIGLTTYEEKLNEDVIKEYKFDIVQLPFNVYDQHRYENGFLSILKENNVEIHARSIFLQGLLLLGFNNLDYKFSSIKEHQKKMHNFFHLNGMSVIEGCLCAILQNKKIDKIIVGCENLIQLKEILNSYKNVINFHRSFNFKEFIIHDKKIINPGLWKIDEK